jgi:A nuclease family of the HNH/ENDO VII superfamily with conserved AHH
VTKPGVGTNRFAYGLGDPVNLSDPGGNAIETPWDVVNLGIGLASLYGNLEAGNYGWAAVDVVAIALDAGATAVPGIPGGASTLNAASRTATRGSKVARAEFSAATKRELREAGLAPDGSAFHHIVEAGNDSSAARSLREKLADAGIDVASATNGVGLVNHTPGRHANVYAEAMERRMRSKITREEIVSEMAKVRSELMEVDRAISEGTRDLSRSGTRGNTVREWSRDQLTRERAERRPIR